MMLIRKGAKMKRIDDEEFTKMWLNAEITPKEIADHFGHTTNSIHEKRRVLGLPPKGTVGFGLSQYAKRKHELHVQKIFKFLKNEGGFYPHKLLSLKFSERVLTRLRNEKGIFTITFNFGRSSGMSHMRKKHHLIFKKPYIFKCFVCNSRTAMIRLMSQALKKPETEQLQKTITSFLTRYLTDAERFAVMWKLGIRKWERSQVKSSIQIDGVVKPLERHLHSVQPTP